MKKYIIQSKENNPNCEHHQNRRSGYQSLVFYLYRIRAFKCSLVDMWGHLKFWDYMYFWDSLLWHLNKNFWKCTLLAKSCLNIFKNRIIFLVYHIDFKFKATLRNWALLLAPSGLGIETVGTLSICFRLITGGGHASCWQSMLHNL